MSLFGKLVDSLGGSVVSAVADTVKAYFPPSMSDKEKAELEMAIREAENKANLERLKLAHQADAEFNQRIKDLEGTASDLKALPVVGPLMLFLRGCQRPAWGIGTLWIDFQVFSGAWDVNLKTDQGWTPEGLALVIVNLLVLGFLFGERAVANVMPLVTQYMAAKSGGSK